MRSAPSAWRALAGAASLATVLLAACGPSRGRMLVGEISQAVQTNPGHVDLAALYPARWDRVCVLTPGITREQVTQLLGFAYSAGPQLVARGDVAGLVFVRHRDVLTAVRYPRRDGDFAAAGRSYCLPRAAAVFRVAPGVGAGGGRPLLPAQPATATP